MADGRIVIDTLLDMSGVEKGLTDLQGKLKTSAGKLNETGKTLTKRVTTPIVALGGFALKTGMDYEASMSKVQAMTGASADEMEQMKEVARELGATTRFSANEAAEGMAFLGMAGFDTNEIIATMPGLLDLAIAGQLELGAAADITTNILSGFGMQAEDTGRVADVLAYAASNANTSVEQMGGAMSYVGPVAAGAGISIEETAASIGILSDAGIQGERAGTALRSMIASLQNPTGQTAKALEDLGLSADDVNPSMHSLTDILKTLEDAGMDSSQAMQLVGVEAGPALLAMLSQGSEGLAAFTGELENAEGSASDMAATMGDNTKGSFAELQSAIEELALQISDILLPIFRDFVDWLTGIANELGKMDSETLKTIMQFAALAAAIGPILIGIAGLINAFNGAIQAIKLVGVALNFLTSGPIGIAILAIALLATLIITYWDEIKEYTIMAWGAIRDFFVETWEWIKETFTTTVEAISEFLSNAWTSIQETAVEIWEGIKDFFIETWEAVKEVFSNALQAIIDLVTERFDWLIEGISTIFENIVNIFENYWEIIKNVFVGAVLVILQAVTGDFEGMRESIAGIMDNIKSAIESIWESIKTIFNTFLDTVWTATKNAFTNIKESISSAMDSIWDGINDVLTSIKNFFSESWENIKTTSQNAIDNVKEAASTGFQNMFDSIKETISDIPGAIKDIWDEAISYLKSIDLKQIGKDIIDGLIGGIKDKANAAVDAVKGVVDDAISGAKNLLGISSPSKLFFKFGEWTDEGFIDGLMSMQDKVAAAGEEMVEAAIPDYKVSYAGFPDLGANVEIPAIQKVNVNRRFDEAGSKNNIDREVVVIRDDSGSKGRTGDNIKIVAGDVILEGRKVGKSIWRIIKDNIDEDDKDTVAFTK